MNKADRCVALVHQKEVSEWSANAINGTADKVDE
jgi:hypothetical protein